MTIPTIGRFHPLRQPLAIAALDCLPERRGFTHVVDLLAPSFDRLRVGETQFPEPGVRFEAEAPVFRRKFLDGILVRWQIGEVPEEARRIGQRVNDAKPFLERLALRLDRVVVGFDEEAPFLACVSRSNTRNFPPLFTFSDRRSE
jgi:hypothetical protein